LARGEHFWIFARRDDLDVYWPQDNGEIHVRPDLTWTASIFLGVEDRPADIHRDSELVFGTTDTLDNRDLAAYCTNCLSTGFFPGRHLPRSFNELAHISIRRTQH